MQRDYVVKFLVEDVPRDVEEALLSDGRFAVSRRCGRTVIEGEDSAADAGAAAKAMAEHLRLGGVSVRSVMPELVTMADIHRRAGVSKQAVSKWVNNPRDNEFPEPYCFTDSSPSTNGCGPRGINTTTGTSRRRGRWHGSTNGLPHPLTRGAPRIIARPSSGRGTAHGHHAAVQVWQCFGLRRG